jgi:D-alanyl-D-alanine carboxypeptidase
MLRGTTLLLLLLVAINSGAASTPAWDSTPAEKRVKAYVEAFNAGDVAQMRDFISKNFSDSALAQRSLDDRIQTYQRIRRDIPRLDVERVLSSEQGRTVLLAKSGADSWLLLEFAHEGRAPFKLLSLRIEPSDSSETQIGSPLTEKEALDSISSLLQNGTDADSFAGVVLVARGGEPRLRQAFGLADREHHAANTPDTKFNLGSIGKSFTQVAIRSLMDDSRLTATDTLGKFLPDYPNAEARRKVTVQELLDHRSGIGDFFGPEYVRTSRDRIRTLRDYLPLFASKPLQFEPGAQERYSNGGYVVLGLIIEAITGMSYYDYISEVVFNPAGMKDSGWYESDAIVPGRAIGYTHRWNPELEQDSPELRNSILAQPGRGSSAGGGYSTVDDLLRYATALEQGKLKGLDGRGLGIAGGSPGVNAVLESGTSGGYTVIVLCNLDPPIAEKKAQTIRAYLRRVKG